ncbi:hypothetical protein HYW99_03595 [Candidatus Woesearchaeota archaeon]|nr:hypothetical protein [Candidatus Woesearchaeota archaeon]
MTNWRKKIQIKHLLTESEEHKAIQESMAKIADVLDQHYEFKRSPLLHRMKNIPQCDDVITPQDYANKLISVMYDIADEERIWIE